MFQRVSCISTCAFINMQENGGSWIINIFNSFGESLNLLKIILFTLTQTKARLIPQICFVVASEYQRMNRK